MYFNYATSILNLCLLGIHTFAQVAAAVLIFIKHHERGNRSWKILFIFFLVSAIASVVEAVLIWVAPAMLDAYKIMNPIIITNGYWIFALLLFYLQEVVNLRGFAPKYGVVVLLPWFVLTFLLTQITLFGDIHYFWRIQDIGQHIHFFDVQLRIILTLLPLPYALGLLFVRDKWRSKMSCHPIMLTIVVMLVAMCVTYICSRGLQLWLAYVLHEALYIAISILILYMEFYERLHIPKEAFKSYYQTHTTKIFSPREKTIQNTVEALQELMQNPEVWQNPDLTRDELVALAGTNRTYFQLAVKQMGFDNSLDMVHSRRVEYICQQLRENPHANISALVYDAGYRSRTTAWRQFVRVVGCTPTEFIQKNHYSPSN